MQPVNIINAKAGMVLSKPVIDDKGRTLCGKGTKLSEKLIQRFDKMGISLIYIESDESITDEEFNQMREDIIKIYKKTDETNLIYSMKQVLIDNLESRKEKS